MSEQPWFSWHKRLGRLQLSLTIYRHRSHLPDRWVVKPNLVYDLASRGVFGDPE